MQRTHTQEAKKKEGGKGADSLGIIGSGGEGWGTGSGGGVTVTEGGWQWKMH